MWTNLITLFIAIFLAALGNFLERHPAKSPTFREGHRMANIFTLAAVILVIILLFRL